MLALPGRLPKDYLPADRDSSSLPSMRRRQPGDQQVLQPSGPEAAPAEDLGPAGAGRVQISQKRR